MFAEKQTRDLQENEEFRAFVARGDFAAAYLSPFYIKCVADVRSKYTMAGAFKISFIFSQFREGGLYPDLAEYYGRFPMLKVLDDIDAYFDTAFSDNVTSGCSIVDSSENNVDVGVGSFIDDGLPSDVDTDCALSGGSFEFEDSCDTANSSFGVEFVQPVIGCVMVNDSNHIFPVCAPFETLSEFDDFLFMLLLEDNDEYRRLTYDNYGVDFRDALETGSCWLRLFSVSDWRDLKYKFKLGHRLTVDELQPLRYLSRLGGPFVRRCFLGVKIHKIGPTNEYYHLREHDLDGDLDYGIVDSLEFIHDPAGCLIVCKVCAGDYRTCRCKSDHDMTSTAVVNSELKESLTMVTQIENLNGSRQLRFAQALVKKLIYDGDDFDYSRLPSVVYQRCVSLWKRSK